MGNLEKSDKSKMKKTIKLEKKLETGRNRYPVLEKATGNRSEPDALNSTEPDTVKTNDEPFFLPLIKKRTSRMP